MKKKRTIGKSSNDLGYEMYMREVNRRERRQEYYKKVRAENEEKEKTLSRLRSKIEKLIGLLFLLTINMNAGLDNQAYIDAYAESENVISQYIENAE